MQNTINAIRSDFTRISNEFRSHWRHEFNRISEKCAVAVMTWLLSKRAVQHVVADTFKKDTPMCRVLSNAIELVVGDMQDRTIDADSIQGLEREIESAIESAFDGHDFERAIKDAFNPDDLMESIDMDELAEKVSERVVDELVRKLTR